MLKKFHRTPKAPAVPMTASMNDYFKVKKSGSNMINDEYYNIYISAFHPSFYLLQLKSNGLNWKSDQSLHWNLASTESFKFFYLSDFYLSDFLLHASVTATTATACSNLLLLDSTVQWSEWVQYSHNLQSKVSDTDT